MPIEMYLISKKFKEIRYVADNRKYNKEVL